MVKHSITRAEFASPTWTHVREHLEARKAELREQLESDSDHDTTTKLRGRIAELNELLRLEKAPAEVPQTGDRLSAADLRRR